MKPLPTIYGQVSRSACCKLNTNTEKTRDSQDRGKGGKGAPGALITSADDSATPWGPQAKKTMGPSVQETLTQPVLFSSLPPHSASLSLPLLFIRSLTHWQRTRNVN